MLRMVFVKGKEMEGKPWTVEEEKQFQQLLAEKKSVRVIARTMGKSRDCIRQKVMRFGLEVVEQEKKIYVLNYY
jgi:IS30 family transposase